MVRNVEFTTFSQQIICDKLLSIVNDWQKSDFSGRFKLKPITTNNLLWIIVKILWL